MGRGELGGRCGVRSHPPSRAPRTVAHQRCDLSSQESVFRENSKTSADARLGLFARGSMGALHKKGKGKASTRENAKQESAQVPQKKHQHIRSICTLEYPFDFMPSEQCSFNAQVPQYKQNQHLLTVHSSTPIYYMSSEQCRFDAQVPQNLVTQRSHAGSGVKG